MELIHENTNKLLQAFIKKIQEKSQSWRLITIEFQDCQTLHAPLFQNLCHKNLVLFFEQTECQIFWQKPGMIFVFFQGRAMPIEKCVEGFLKEVEFKDSGRFFDILDLSIHWNTLLAMINRIFPNNTPEAHEANTSPQIQPDAPPPQAPITFQQGFNIELSRQKIESLIPIRNSRTKPLLLLVEDDPFTLQLVKLAFKDSYDIIAAETARQALVYYQRHLPDMVFLDIQLPDGNGINLLQQMKAADTGSYVVMLSSHSQKEKIIECQNYGAKGFIAKPFTRQRLIDATEKYKTSKKSA